jgi:hypothetical protein
MTTFLLRYVEPGAAEIILAANGHAGAYELTLDQIRALAIQASDIVTKWTPDEVETAR